MKYVGPIRKALGIPTCFNLLGPLINPCSPKYQLLGVANLMQMRLYSSVLQKINVEYGIVNSTDGYDEISLTSPYKMLTRYRESVLTAAHLDLKQVKPEEIYGGATPQKAKEIFDHVLDNTASPSQIAVVLVNAAFAIQIIKPEKSIEACLEEAKDSLYSGQALAKFQRFIELNS